MANGQVVAAILDAVRDDEVVFRNVRRSPDCFALRDGRLHVSASAFNDTMQRPSVNRAALAPEPLQTRIGSSDGVIRLLVEAIRAIDHIKTIHQPAPGQPRVAQNYSLDVVARPIPANDPSGVAENPAHAQIECDPAAITGAGFKKVKEALAAIAGHESWVVRPE